MRSIDAGAKTPFELIVDDGCYEAATVLLAQSFQRAFGGDNGFASELLRGHRAFAVALMRCDVGKIVSLPDQSTGRTLLHVAAGYGNSKTCECLVQYGADLRKLDKDGKTPFELAMDGGHDEVATVLLRCLRHCHPDHKKAFLTYQSAKGAVLHIAARCGNAEACEFLVQHGADMRQLDSGFKIPFDVAFDAGHMDVAAVLLAQSFRRAFGEDNGFASELLCSHRAFARVFWGCDAESYVSLHDQSTGRTLLHIAAGCGNSKTCECLVQHGADMRRLDNDGKTPFDLAFDGGHNEAAIFFFAKSFQRAFGKNNGFASELFRGHRAFAGPLMRCDFEDFVSLLDQSTGRTLLHIAAGCGNAKTCECLVQHGADMRQLDNDGKTPFDLAMDGGHICAGTFLLTQRCQCAFGEGHEFPSELLRGRRAFAGALMRCDDEKIVSIPDQSTGRTLLHIAAGCGNAKTCECLVQHGADMRQLDKDGKTPFDLALDGGYIDAAAALLAQRSRSAFGEDHGFASKLLRGHRAFARAFMRCDHHEIASLTDPATGRTVLHIAASAGDAKVCKHLVEQGAVVRKQDKNCKTAHELAKISGHQEVAIYFQKFASISEMRGGSGGAKEDALKFPGHVTKVVWYTLRMPDSAGEWGVLHSILAFTISRGLESKVFAMEKAMQPDGEELFANGVFVSHWDEVVCSVDQVNDEFQVLNEPCITTFITMKVLYSMAVGMGPYVISSCNCHHMALTLYNYCAPEYARIDERDMPNANLSSLAWFLGPFVNLARVQSASSRVSMSGNVNMSRSSGQMVDVSKKTVQEAMMVGGSLWERALQQFTMPSNPKESDALTRWARQVQDVGENMLPVLTGVETVAQALKESCEADEQPNVEAADFPSSMQFLNFLFGDEGSESVCAISSAVAEKIPFLMQVYSLYKALNYLNTRRTARSWIQMAIRRLTKHLVLLYTRSRATKDKLILQVIDDALNEAMEQLQDLEASLENRVFAPSDGAATYADIVRKLTDSLTMHASIVTLATADPSPLVPGSRNEGPGVQNFANESTKPSSAGQEPVAQATSELHVGAKVRTTGLQTMEHNNKTGVIVARHRERWVVKFDTGDGLPDMLVGESCRQRASRTLQQNRCPDLLNLLALKDENLVEEEEATTTWEVMTGGFVFTNCDGSKVDLSSGRLLQLSDLRTIPGQLVQVSEIRALHKVHHYGRILKPPGWIFLYNEYGVADCGPMQAKSSANACSCGQVFREGHTFCTTCGKNRGEQEDWVPLPSLDDLRGHQARARVKIVSDAAVLQQKLQAGWDPYFSRYVGMEGEVMRISSATPSVDVTLDCDMATSRWPWDALLVKAPFQVGDHLLVKAPFQLVFGGKEYFRAGDIGRISAMPTENDTKLYIRWARTGLASCFDIRKRVWRDCFTLLKGANEVTLTEGVEAAVDRMLFRGESADEIIQKVTPALRNAVGKYIHSKKAGDIFGTWVYWSDSSQKCYEVGFEENYIVVYESTTHGVVKGILYNGSHGLEGPVLSGSQIQGKIRLRTHGSNQMISNCKGLSDSEWGPDTILHRSAR